MLSVLQKNIRCSILDCMKIFMNKEKDNLRQEIFNDLIDMHQSLHKAAGNFCLDADANDIKECEKILNTTEKFIPILREKIEKYKG